MGNESQLTDQCLDTSLSGIYHPSPTSPSSSTTRIRILQYEAVKPVNHAGVAVIDEPDPYSRLTGMKQLL